MLQNISDVKYHFKTMQAWVPVEKNWLPLNATQSRAGRMQYMGMLVHQ